MATVAKPGIDSFSFSGEDAGVSAAVALRKVRPLAECAPPGRLFAAISTLADTSATAANEFEAACLAELNAEAAKAAKHLARGTRMAKRLKETAEAIYPAPLPAFVRHK